MAAEEPAASPTLETDVLARVRGAKAEVTIGKSGGRPILAWVGKRAPATVKAFPAQLIETYGEAEPHGALWHAWPHDLCRGGLLYHGDNKEVLAHLLANGFRGQVKLVYIDPPFDSGADYVRKIELRGPKGKVKLDGEGYTLGEQIQYTDIWANDNYLQFMFERLLLLKELISDDGFIALHCDETRNSYLRIILDEVFGSTCFRNEIVWHYSGWNRYLESGLNKRHDTILVYGKSKAAKFLPVSMPWESKDAYVTARKQKVHIANDGREYVLSDAGGGERVARFLDEAIAEGRPIDDVWELDKLNNSSKESCNYETQKPEHLLERVLACFTTPGDLVLDCFIGSGTAAAVAQKLGRRWIGCDINKGAIQTTARRLQLIMADQAREKRKPAQAELLGEGEAPVLAQLGFTHWRVNDYDLAIQHNEAVNLACEYLGVERLRSDAFFDGLLGKRLVKITPFGHPLSPMDLEAIRYELDARPEEDRAITVVCLGQELAADRWLAEWNRLRRKKTDPHHIEVIELRSDPTYGGFIQHAKAQARVVVKRKGGKLHVAVKDFVSPGILQRLAQQSGVVQPKVVNWRSMVDSVMIDTGYDGAVFNVIHADVPARKVDLVTGEYELDCPKGATKVAVKVTDMLGEEVMVVCTA